MLACPWEAFRKFQELHDAFVAEKIVSPLSFETPTFLIFFFYKYRIDYELTCF